MFNMDAPCTFHIRKVSPSILGRLLCPSQYSPLPCIWGDPLHWQVQADMNIWVTISSEGIFRVIAP
jgi:hypothetical protein